MRVTIRTIYTVICYAIGSMVLMPISLSAGIGEGAIITLKFPFGARAGGLGETYTGIANTIDATYYNPAGLGQEPLSNAWKSYFPVSETRLTAICAKRDKGFNEKDKVWLGTDTKGLFMYNGKVWLSYDIYVISEGDNLNGIAQKFLQVTDKNLINRAVKEIKRANNIELKQFEYIKNIIEPYIMKDDTLPESRRVEKLDEIIESILNLDKEDQNKIQIYGIVATKVDSLAADSLAEKIAAAFSIEDVHFSDLIDLKVPFTIAVQDTVTALAMDDADRLWVGTVNGLWRYGGSSWNHYSMKDGLLSNRIQCIAIGPKLDIAIGTPEGINTLSEGNWSSSTQGLADPMITALCFSRDGTLFAGCPQGVMRQEKEGFTLLDTASGLFTPSVSALHCDSYDQLWVGGNDGVVIFTQDAVKRYKFPGSTIHRFVEDKPGSIWIATNRGAIAYTAGKEGPQWRPFHSKNALSGDLVSDISIQGRDIWLITENGVSQRIHGTVQGTVYVEPILPLLKIQGLWHFAAAGTVPIEDLGTVGIFFNFLNFGPNEEVDINGVTIKKYSAYEYVASLCYGYGLTKDFSTGVNVKFIKSKLGTGPGTQGTATSFAVDLAMLRRDLLIKNLSLGLSIMNMGPPVYYTSKDNSDPILFSLQLGSSYTLVETPVHNVLVAVDLERELAKHDPHGKPYPFWEAIYYDMLNDTAISNHNSTKNTIKKQLRQFIGHMGVEYWYAYAIALRLGYMLDIVGKRKEINIGVGFKYSTIAFDWGLINSLDPNSIRIGQWRTSLTFSF